MKATVLNAIDVGYGVCEEKTALVILPTGAGLEAGIGPPNNGYTPISAVYSGVDGNSHQRLMSNIKPSRTIRDRENLTNFIYFFFQCYDFLSSHDDDSKLIQYWFCK
jgi:hypothetical protein